MTISEPVNTSSARSAIRVAAARPARRRGADHRRRADGRRPAGRARQRDHATGPAGRRLRRDGEPRRERPDRPASDQARPHHVHLPRRGQPAAATTQKAAFRRAVNRAHAQVYSTDESPVALQRVRQGPAAVGRRRACTRAPSTCYRTFVGEMDDETADRHYREGMSLGTTLQVPAGHVARRPGRLRRVLAGVARQGAHRRRCPRVPVADRGGPHRGVKLPRPGAARAGRTSTC